MGVGSDYEASGTVVNAGDFQRAALSVHLINKHTEDWPRVQGEHFQATKREKVSGGIADII